jgi:DNA-binding TFAR19-related protein (PDSD5 family)
LAHCLKFLERCTFLLLLFCSCNEREERNVQHSFYYWKTVFNLTPKEQETLKQQGIQNLYVKFFDVDWNESTQSAEPVAKSVFDQKQPSGVSITPVVFITQEPLQKQDTSALATLAANISNLLSSIASNNGLNLSAEVQLDCDWTAKTKDAYFYLINQLKKQPFFQKKTVSATIRLHQLKFVTQNGVPPVDKGLLMCYNMGNLRHPQTENSIIDEDELKKYINNLEKYSLPLHVALPVFDWYVLFEANTYKGLLRDFTIDGIKETKGRIDFDRDTVINGYSFKTGQWLRHERSDAAIVKKCAERISRKLKSKELTVILYHLDSRHLSKYNQNELESFYNSFR